MPNNIKPNFMQQYPQRLSTPDEKRLVLEYYIKKMITDTGKTVQIEDKDVILDFQEEDYQEFREIMEQCLFVTTEINGQKLVQFTEISPANDVYADLMRYDALITKEYVTDWTGIDLLPLIAICRKEMERKYDIETFAIADVFSR